MNDLEYSLKIESLYRRIWPNLQFDADSIRLHPQECLEDGLNILYALGIIQKNDISRMAEEYSFGTHTLHEYIDIHGTSSIDTYIDNLQGLINDHLKTAEDSSVSFEQEESASTASPDVEANEQEITTEGISSTEGSKETPAPAKRKFAKKKIVAFGGIAVVALAVVLIVARGGSSKKKFTDMYSDLASNSWCTIASDGSYMKIDTNPKDKDTDDFTWSDWETYLAADAAIETTNKDLGFSDALMEKMNTTTWSQGRQTESNDKYTVTWTYHPDKGLEVLYEFKK